MTCDKAEGEETGPRAIPEISNLHLSICGVRCEEVKTCAESSSTLSQDPEATGTVIRSPCLTKGVIT